MRTAAAEQTSFIYPLLSFVKMSLTEFSEETNRRHRQSSSSSSSEQESDLSDYVLTPSSSPPPSSLITPDTSPSEVSEQVLWEQDSNTEYFAQFLCPSDSDDDDEFTPFKVDDNNDELFLGRHLTCAQQDSIDRMELETYRRRKRSNKKSNAKCQIKTKYAKSIKVNSHNKSLYIHHRLAKKIVLDEPSQHYLPSYQPPRTLSPESFRSIVQEHRTPGNLYNHSRTTIHDPPYNPVVTNQFRDYTINESNIPDELLDDDAMVAFLLEMQNRELSPEDYEMLLRLDESVQRKTVHTSVLDTLTTINANENHLNERCAICMDTYDIGEELKLLPCLHIFHLTCIDTYLKDFSIQCPLDNLPLS